MGSAFVKRAAALGHTVYAWNRSREKLAGLPAKAISLEEARGLIAVFVADDEAMLGVVDRLKSGVVALMGTYSVEATAEAVKRLASRGIPAVSSPIVGGPGNVERGDAIYLVGGDRHRVEELAPLYSQLGKAIFLGSAEEAAALKLAYNALLIGVVAVLGEAASLAKAYGVLSQFKDLLSMTVFKDVGAAYLDRIFSTSPGTFALKHAAKDLRYALLAASKRGLPLATISAAKSLYEVLTALGRGDEYYVRAGALEGGSA